VYDVPPAGSRRRQQKTETLEGVSKKQAEAILAARRATVVAQFAAINNGEQIKDEVELSSLLDDFMKAKSGSKKESATIKRYASLVKHYLKPLVGDKKAKALKPYHLMDAYSEWLNQGRDGRRISPSTVRHAHELLRNVLGWGVRRELLSRNVATLVSDDDLPKATKPKPLALDELELQRLLNEAKNPTKLAKNRGTLSSQPWFYPAVVFAACTGARRGEILALRWTDVNFDAKSVSIERSLTGELEFKNPKNDRSRTISVPDFLCEVLGTHRARQAAERLAIGAGYKDQGLVFARADGTCVGPGTSVGRFSIASSGLG
jgi:integrase